MRICYKNLKISMLRNVETNQILDILRFEPLVFHSKMSRQRFHEFMLSNEFFRIERDRHGTITIHQPLGLEDGFLEGIPFFFCSNGRNKTKLAKPSALPPPSTCPMAQLTKPTVRGFPMKKFQN